MRPQRHLRLEQLRDLREQLHEAREQLMLADTAGARWEAGNRYDMIIAAIEDLQQFPPEEEAFV